MGSISESYKGAKVSRSFSVKVACYTIPNYALKIVNSVLGAIGAKRIQPSGGPKSGEFTIWKPGPASACPKRKPGR